MDRDQRWERNKLAWDAIVLGRGDGLGATRRALPVRAAYAEEPRGDEFLQPIIFSHANEQRVRDGDVVLWFNFRADRARQLSDRLSARRSSPASTARCIPRVHYVTLTEYDETYGCPVVFAPQSLDAHPRRSRERRRAASSSASPRRRNTRTSPSSSMAASRQPFPGEDREIVPSPKDVPTYDFKPQMSAPEVTRAVRRSRSSITTW